MVGKNSVWCKSAESPINIRPHPVFIHKLIPQKDITLFLSILGSQHELKVAKESHKQTRTLLTQQQQPNNNSDGCKGHTV